VYFNTNAGTKTVRIVNPDLCHPANAGSDDRDYGGYSNGSVAVDYLLYEVTGAASLVDSAKGYVRTGSSACTPFVDMTIAGSKLALDANTGKYKARVKSQVNGGKDIAASFKVRLPNNDGIVGTQAGTTTNIDIDGRRTSYATISLKFAPPCSMTANELATAIWYDDDNNPPIARVQPAKFKIRVVEVSPSGTRTNIPLTSAKLTSAGGNTYYPTAGSGTGKFTFTAKPKHKYEWVWSRIYDNNALQFQIPYNSVDYAVTCPAAPPSDGDYIITTNAPGHEKGSGDTTVSSTLSASTYPCDKSKPVGTGTVATIVNWNVTGPNGFNKTGVANIPNCSGSLGGTTSLSGVASGAYLDGLGIGPLATYVGAISSYGGSVPTGSYSAAPSSISIYEVPFARFFGHDVRVCTDANANRFMWDNRGGQPAQKGSFASLAAIFASAVTGFDGLHTNTLTDRDSLDTMWALQPSCTPVSIDMPTTETALPVGLNADAGKRYYKPTSNISIGGPLTGQVTIDSADDVYITSDITSAIPTSSINTATDPVLLIKAKNIYIDKSVTRVDGILFASGDIHTCTNGGTIYLPALLDNNCDKPLIINGAITAGGKVSFERAKGTRYLSNPTLTTPGLGAPAADNTNPAETINFPTYLNFMTLNTKVKSSGGYDSYTILPPRL
jgi:hypothetical protein